MKTKVKLTRAGEERSKEFERIGNNAIRRAREENRQLGLPNFSERGGKLIIEMPDGSVVAEELPVRKKERKRPPEAA